MSNRTPGSSTIRLKRLEDLGDIRSGRRLDLLTAGACNVQLDGELQRGTGRDGIRLWAQTRAGLRVAEVEVHEKTHGHGYDYQKDGPGEQLGRQLALVRLYELKQE